MGNIIVIKIDKSVAVIGTLKQNQSAHTTSARLNDRILENRYNNRDRRLDMS